MFYYSDMEASPEMNFVALLAPLAGMIFIIAVGVILLNQQFQKKLIQQQLAKEELKNKHQTELLHTAIQAQEDERKRIAQDLHDELSAALSISRMQMVQLESLSIDEFDKIATDLPQIRSNIESALTSTRRISHELMPPHLVNLGLINALEELIHRVEKTGQLEVSITSVNDSDFSWPVKIGLFRIFSELINNTLKHAEASHATINIFSLSGELHCEYQDNGIGMQYTSSSKGIGMKSIEGRTKALGGKFSYESQNPEGFYIKIILPIKNENHDGEN